MIGNTYSQLEADDARLLAAELPLIPGVQLSPVGHPTPTPPPPSPIEQMLSTIERHIVEEAGSVEAYRRLAQMTHDPVASLLMETIIADEDRHHALLQRMSGSLRDALDWLHSAESLPDCDRPIPPPSDEAIIATEQFIKEERAGARELRQLARQERRLHNGLFSLLLESMALDSEKHERLLTFIRDRLKSAR